MCPKRSPFTFHPLLCAYCDRTSTVVAKLLYVYVNSTTGEPHGLTSVGSKTLRGHRENKPVWVILLGLYASLQKRTFETIFSQAKQRQGKRGMGVYDYIVRRKRKWTYTKNFAGSGVIDGTASAPEVVVVCWNVIYSNLSFRLSDRASA
jgi:hypothetical protein